VYIIIACQKIKCITYFKNYNKLHNFIISILLYKQYADINYILGRKKLIIHKIEKIKALYA
jgi:hypothetical protein